MLTECQENKEYDKGAGTKGESFATESLFMALIFQHQKMSKELIN
jgi:hypothetical protein